MNVRHGRLTRHFLSTSNQRAGAIQRAGATPGGGASLHRRTRAVCRWFCSWFYTLCAFLVSCLALLAIPQLGFAADAADRLQLLGSITGAKPVALLKNRDTGQVKAFRKGENVYGLGTVLEVEREVVTLLDNNGQTTYLSSKLGGAFGKGKKVPKILVSTEDKHIEEGFQRIGNKIDVDGAYKERMLKEELPNILMQASSEAVMVNGEIQGFRLFQFDQTSMFGKLGMKDGDIVKEINGVPLNNVAKTLQFLNGLRTESHVSVNIVRDGVPITLDLNVK